MAEVLERPEVAGSGLQARHISRAATSAPAGAATQLVQADRRHQLRLLPFPFGKLHSARLTRRLPASSSSYRSVYPPDRAEEPARLIGIFESATTSCCR